MPGAWRLCCRLLAACVWLRTAAAGGAGPRALGEFRQQLRRAAGGWSPEAGAGASARCQSAFGLMQDHIIRTRDSLGAGASFLSAPAAIDSPAQCLRACCTFPGCTVAVVERGGLHWARGLEAASHPPLSCYLFNCTARGRDVCRFSPHRGYSSFSRGPLLPQHGDSKDPAWGRGTAHPQPPPLNTMNPQTSLTHKPHSPQHLNPQHPKPPLPESQISPHLEPPIPKPPSP